MKRILFLLALIAGPLSMMAQQEPPPPPGAVQPVDTSWKKIYRATTTRINDLVHADGSAAGTEVIIKIPAIYD